MQNRPFGSIEPILTRYRNTVNKRKQAAPPEGNCLHIDKNFFLWCFPAGAGLGLQRDGAAFGFDQLLREDHRRGLGHRDDGRLAGLGPEDHGFGGLEAFGAVHLRALVFAVVQGARALVDTGRIDLDLGAVEQKGDQFGATEFAVFQLKLLGSGKLKVQR